ncbi:MAG: prephenate dehydrogenase/arogenate dehydrogenase family protein [Anaerolineae bacterium]|jgi:prephenate dehydrogenase|nr:prephenate dehydrogenase/arogenate dehydrogenase family protein [Anaerolineae bacterium]
MADKLHIAIVGLGLVGQSIGLALRRYPEKVTVVGHDPSPDLSSKAKRAGAVERAEWNLINAVINADRIVLALPLNEIRATLEAIKQDLQPGCVIVDTADVKAPVMQWAAEILPPEVHFVGGHPILLTDALEPDAARADLFDGKLFCLTPDARTDAAGVRLAADIAEAIGAKPYFMDAQEHDGLAAGAQNLPALLAAALMAVTTGSPGWKEMRKLAGNQYYAGTLLVAGSGKQVAADALANRENTVHWLDAVMAELQSYKAQLLAGDAEEMAKDVDRGLAAGKSWLNAAVSGQWEIDGIPPTPQMGMGMRELFFGRLGKPRERPQGDKGKK